MLNANKMTAASDLSSLSVEDCKMLKVPADQNLFMDLNEKDSETVSGGHEVFTIKNTTNYTISFILDGTLFTQRPNESFIYTAFAGGNILLDTDGRSWHTQLKSYNLDEGELYEFQDNNSTRGNPWDLDLYRVV